MYRIIDDIGNASVKYESKDDALKAYRDWKESYLSDEVTYDSWVTLSLYDTILEKWTIIRKSTIVEDKDFNNEIGSPNSNGFDYDFWAKWHEQ